MMMRNCSRFVGQLPMVFMLGLVLLLSGCAGLGPKTDSVKVNLSQLRILDSTVFEQRYEAKIRIQNRSQSVLDINGLSYDLSLNGKEFATGVSNQEIMIEPLSEGVVTINLTSTLFSLIRQIEPMQSLHSKPLEYELSGRIYTDSDFFRVPFSEKGEVDLTRPAQQIK